MASVRMVESIYEVYRALVGPKAVAYFELSVLIVLPSAVLFPATFVTPEMQVTQITSITSATDIHQQRPEKGEQRCRPLGWGTSFRHAAAWSGLQLPASSRM